MQEISEDVLRQLRKDGVIDDDKAEDYSLEGLKSLVEKAGNGGVVVFPK